MKSDEGTAPLQGTVFRVWWGKSAAEEADGKSSGMMPVPRRLAAWEKSLRYRGGDR